MGEEIAPMMSSIMTIIMMVVMINVIIQVLNQILPVLGAAPSQPQPQISIHPTTIRTTESFTCTWSGFKDGYWIYLRHHGGMPCWGLGNKGSGTMQCQAPVQAGTYYLRAEQPLNSIALLSNEVKLTVTT